MILDMIVFVICLAGIAYGLLTVARAIFAKSVSLWEKGITNTFLGYGIRVFTVAVGFGIVFFSAKLAITALGFVL